VVGGWWYQDKEDNMVRKSSFKTIFYAMGSICFGSLFVGPVRLVRQVAVIFRPTTDETSLLCLHEFMLCLQTGVSNCVDGLSERFNPWAFTYVGLYQYGFVDAGRNVSELFEKRGWNTIVSDDLVPNVLLLTSLVIGGVTGVFCHLLSELENLNILAATEQGLVAFGVGTAIGVVVTSILFGLISSSVNAVIVCFATSPFDFEENHAELSHEMRAAWREVWPGALDMVDMNQAMWGDSPSGHEEFAAFLPYA
jgi:Plasma-membrane choline transporter